MKKKMIKERRNGNKLSKLNYYYSTEKTLLIFLLIQRKQPLKIYSKLCFYPQTFSSIMLDVKSQNVCLKVKQFLLIL